MNSEKTTIVVRLIIEKDDKILFLKKTTQNGGGYSLIGGKVDEGESASVAIIRESHEEANVKIKRRHLRLVHIFKRDSQRELILVFIPKKWKGELESKELEKFKKVTWIKKTDLPNNISEVTGRLLEAYNDGQFFYDEIRFNHIEKKNS